MLLRKWRLPRWLHGKESTCQCKRHGSVPGLGRSHVLREAKPTHHRCWVCAPEPGSCDSWSPHAPQPALHKRGHCSEAHVLQQGVSPPLPLATAREKAEQRQRPSTAISKWIQLKKEKKRRAVSLVENVPSGYEQEMNSVRHCPGRCVWTEAQVPGWLQTHKPSLWQWTDQELERKQEGQPLRAVLEIPGPPRPILRYRQVSEIWLWDKLFLRRCGWNRHQRRVGDWVFKRGLLKK